MGSSTTLASTGPIPEVSEEDHDLVLSTLRELGNPISQQSLERLQELLPRIPVTELRNYVQSLIAGGEFGNLPQ
jgi:hypothetical protein